MWKKGKMTSEKIWIILKKSRYDIENKEEIVKRNGKYGRKVSWIVNWLRKFNRKVCRIVKRF
jgi:hypothetical protein